MPAKKKSSKAPSSTPRSAAPKEVLVVGSKVKNRVRALGLRCSGDFVDALSARVDRLIVEAADRAKKHGVMTVGQRDL